MSNVSVRISPLVVDLASRRPMGPLLAFGELAGCYVTAFRQYSDDAGENAWGELVNGGGHPVKGRFFLTPTIAIAIAMHGLARSVVSTHRITPNGAKVIDLGTIDPLAW